MRCIRENFIPVAVDKLKLFAPGQRAANAAEIACVAKFTGGKSTNLGVYLVAPDGTPLTATGAVYTSADHTLALLKQGLAKFGPVQPREVAAQPVNPERGVGFRADGSTRLALTVRYLDKAQAAGQPVFDSIAFTKEQWAGLLPPDGAKGKYTVPETTVRPFARGVSASSDLSFLIRPQDLGTAVLTGEQVVEQNGLTHLRLTGQLAGKRPQVNEPTKPNGGSLALTGWLILGPQRQPVRLLLVGSGSYQQPWMPRPAPTAALVEWQAAEEKTAR